MQCTFCGTENRPDYKFCGMCGVRLERRQAERRVRQTGVSVECPSCGHQSDPGLKFCGMCGTRIERRMHERRGGASQEPRAVAVANAQLPTPEGLAARPARPSPAVATVDLPEAGTRRGEPAIFRNEPPADSPISGPSFLGLNTQSEGDGEYLLEDEPSRGGLRRLVLLVIIAAILGLVFVQWRSSFKASPKTSPSRTEPSPSPVPQANKLPNSDQPANDGNGVSEKPGSSATSDSATDTKKNQTESPLGSVVPSATAAPASSPDTAESNPSKPEAASADGDSKVPEETRLPDHKPSASLQRAQQYLQGKGVGQSCEQGMLYLKAATDKGDPGAAIQMAALYASGHCVKQDRVMAYRWFNSAHELEPANMWIQKNMDQLWAQMTSQERRLAGY
jgi:double zinc ribbon protein